jgi:predicted nucleic acid-binding protein
MIVVSDTSPINYLVLIDEIDLFPKLFGKIIIPSAVVAELQNIASPQAVKDWIDSPPDWLQIQTPQNIDYTITLGSGEREGISLAKEINSDLILLDDRKARRAAIERGLNVAGTLNILTTASKKEMIDLGDALQKLRKTNFRVSPALLLELLEQGWNHFSK